LEELRSKAFPLRARAYSESDVIAVLLTREHGKLSGIARGARRSKRRFAGPALEPFHEIDARFKRRPHSELVFLEEGRLVESYDALTARVEAFAWGSYLTELIEVVLPAGEACPGVYDLYRSTLVALGRGDAVEPTAQHFVLRALEHAGWCPDFERCGVCGAALISGVRPIVDPRGGGVICARHEIERKGGAPDDAAQRPPRRVIDDVLLAYVRAARDAPGADATTETLSAATALLDRLIALHVPRPLRARRVLGELTQAT
jgi:DNA repair protein RecO (recombination protein O)